LETVAAGSVGERFRRYSDSKEDTVTGGEQPGVALVTGTSSGIGAAFAERLARRGYDLIVVARRRERLLAQAEWLQRETGVAVEVLAADLSDPEDLPRVEARTAGETRLQMLVNNAGLGDLGEFIDVDRDILERMIAVNVLALTRLTHGALPGMLERGGATIINVSSGLAFGCMRGAAVYGASKAFVVHFTELLHAEVGDRGIRLQALIPGLTRTNLGGAEETSFFDQFPPEIVMAPEDLVDASLAGLELGELVCIPRLEDLHEWQQASAAITAIGHSAGISKLASRYSVAASREA
jgi:uncharacterized protein